MRLSARRLETAAGALLFLAFAHPALAANEPPGWSGEAELGLIAISGNTESRNLNAKGKLLFNDSTWRNELGAEALGTSEDDETTAERYVAAAKARYRLQEHDYVFGNLRYENDRFTGYDYQVSEAVGYGSQVIDEEGLTLDLEAGVGGRHSREHGDGTRQDFAILHAAADLVWQATENAELLQELLLETGSENTYVESVSALQVGIGGRLALKLAYTVRHNSEVPDEDTENTDTITSLNLVYGF